MPSQLVLESRPNMASLLEGALVFTGYVLVQSVNVAALVSAVIALQGQGLGRPWAGLLVGLALGKGEGGPAGEGGP